MNLKSYAERQHLNQGREPLLISQLQKIYKLDIKKATASQDKLEHTDAMLCPTPEIVARLKELGVDGDIVAAQEYPVQIKIREGHASQLRTDIGIEVLYNVLTYRPGNPLDGREYENDSLFWISVTPMWLARLYRTNDIMGQVVHLVRNWYDKTPHRKLVGAGWELTVVKDKGIHPHDKHLDRYKLMAYLNPDKLDFDLIASWQCQPPR